ncbi:phenoloxidase-activating factor 2-like [Drosophila willistoni]|uniref:phenoloxidase-activating factor 2-like n=1 Tax=Drosophila willistoni TaxID=7260 RepID=UPI000C26D0E9|nr:phenoloxidase-activating factor 2-like [Drosophila willistoni]
MRRVLFVLLFFILHLICHADDKDDDDSSMEIDYSFLDTPDSTTTSKPKNISCGPRHICVKRADCLHGRTHHSSSYSACIAPHVCCDTSLEQNQPIHINDMEPCGFGTPGNASSKLSTFGEFPWMIAILERDFNPVDVFTNYVGGGSLIAPTVVLTTARIAENKTTDVLFVRAGEYDHTNRQIQHPYQERRVKQIITHEHYDTDSLANGTALLILDTPFSGEVHIRPICLPIFNEFELLDKSQCIVTGWGSVTFRQFDYQMRLKKLVMPVLLQSECNAKFQKTRLGPRYQLDESLLCAGGQRKVDACLGDGGSPLICPLSGSKNRYFQVGMVAWGIGCGSPDVPGAYVNVVYLLPWLNEKLNALGINRKYYASTTS